MWVITQRVVVVIYYLFGLAQQPPGGQGPLTQAVSRTHTTTRHIR